MKFKIKSVGYWNKPLEETYPVLNFYKFEQYGVPQMRHRIIIVGIRNDLAEQGIKFHVPAPTTPNPSDYKTAGEALSVPPIPIPRYWLGK